jgi:cell division protease FtsH
MSEKNHKKGGSSGAGNLYWIYGVILLFIVASFFFLPDKKRQDEITESQFFDQLVLRNRVERVLIVNKEIVEVYLTAETLREPKYQDRGRSGFLGKTLPAYTFKIVAPESFIADLKRYNVNYQVVERTDYFMQILQFIVPIVVLIAVWVFFMRRMGGGMGGSQIFNIGKSRAALFDKENRVKITFSDVAGLEEAKEEVQEVVEFLKNPQKFTRLGGHIPKGVLLVGPPGTGKTLLAKAVAGEAGVPFFSLSGSDFVEMFVGVGAARVRDLFKQAKDKAPCIIFIDEIDAIGRSRGRNSSIGGNDERENTLNQLLVEMDGFNTDVGVIIMAATNRPDVLDGALLRAGRFDRLIAVDRPDLKEREAIFNVHLAKLVCGPDVDVKKLAAQTPGFVGADIMNVANEAALVAARRNKSVVEMEDFQYAIDRVIGGLEKKNKIIQPDEKKVIAYHEAGHAVAGWYLEHADPLVKVSIIPRGVAALGYAQYLPHERYLHNTEQLEDEATTMLAGRAAEEIVFGKISTGAQNDLDRVTKLAYAMVTVYGMNPNVGNLSFSHNDEFTLGKPYSEALAQQIDDEVRMFIKKMYERAKKLLTDKREQLDTLAKTLLEKEVIYQQDIESLLGPRPKPPALLPLPVPALPTAG